MVPPFQRRQGEGEGDLPIIRSNGGLSMGAAVAAGARNPCPGDIPPAGLQEDRFVKHHGVLFPEKTSSKIGI